MFVHVRSRVTLLVTIKPLEFKINYPVTTVRTEVANWQRAKAEKDVHTARLKKGFHSTWEAGKHRHMHTQIPF